MGQGMGGETVNGRLDRRRGDRMGLIAVTSGVKDLQSDFSAFAMHRVGHQTMMPKLAVVIQHRTARHRDAGRRRRDTAGHNQGHTVTRALGIKRRQPFRAIGAFFQTGVHRSHKYAVFQRGEP